MRADAGTGHRGRLSGEFHGTTPGETSCISGGAAVTLRPSNRHRWTVGIEGDAAYNSRFVRDHVIR